MAADRPASMVWSRELFPEDSIGSKIFPEELEGRKRSSRAWYYPARRILSPVKSWEQVAEAGITTSGDIMTRSESQIGPLLKQPEHNLDYLLNRLQSGLLETVYGPYDRLMAAILHLDSTVTPLDLETERDQVINQALAELKPEVGEILRRSFGLDNYQPQTMTDLAPQYKRTRLYLSRIRSNGLQILSHRAADLSLGKYLPKNVD